MSTNSCAFDTIEFEGFRVGRTRLGRERERMSVLGSKLFLILFIYSRWMGSAIGRDRRRGVSRLVLVVVTSSAVSGVGSACGNWAKGESINWLALKLRMGESEENS